MDLDIIALLAECHKKAMAKSQGEFQEEMKACFCDSFIEELKKVKGHDLVPHFLSAEFIVKENKTLVKFLF